MRRFLVQVLVLASSISCLAFFDGCTVAERKAILDEAKQYAIENGKQLMSGALADVQKKLDDAEAKQLSAIDQKLALFKTADENGVETAKTWKDFDSDKDGHLGPIELAKVEGYIISQTARKVASGEMDKQTAATTGKGAAGGLGALLVIYLLRRGKGILGSLAGGGGPTVPNPVPAGPAPPPKA